MLLTANKYLSMSEAPEAYHSHISDKKNNEHYLPIFFSAPPDQINLFITGLILGQKGDVGTQGPRGLRGHRGAPGYGGQKGTQGGPGIKGSKGKASVQHSCLFPQPEVPQNLKS